MTNEDVLRFSSEEELVGSHTDLRLESGESGETLRQRAISWPNDTDVAEERKSK